MESLIDRIKIDLGYSKCTSKTCSNCNYGLQSITEKSESSTCHVYPPKPFKVDPQGVCKAWVEKSMGKKL